MKEPISIYRYSMRSKALLNAKSDRVEHRGALIRLDGASMADGDIRGREFGYGCIHPWPELGDVDLEQTLSLLAEGKYTALSRRALSCARIDAEARSENRSLFAGLTVPKSHATLVLDEGCFQTAVDAGFEIVKVKVGRDCEWEVEFIRAQSAKFPRLEWRLDFNGTLSPERVEKFLHRLGGVVRDKIDFVEDAYTLNTSPWVNALGPFEIPMAVDREVEDACGGYGVAIIKPAVNVVAPILERAVDEQKRVVFTSYMDHPLGQCYAAWEAARAHQAYPGLVDTCGLVTHALFEPDAFTEALGSPGPDFIPPAMNGSGTGLGFDELLENLSWTPLH